MDLLLSRLPKPIIIRLAAFPAVRLLPRPITDGDLRAHGSGG
jgi:hypothetical protein